MKKVLSNRFAKRFLAMALTATMLFGDVTPALATEMSVADGQEMLALTTVSEGDLVVEETQETLESTEESEALESEVVESEVIESEAVESEAIETESGEESAATTATEEAVSEEASTEESATEETVVEESASEESVVEESTESTEETEASSEDVAYVYGTNGIAYDEVTYLTVNTFNSLPAEGQEMYISICDSLAAEIEEGAGLEDVVIYMAGKDEIGISYFVPYNILNAAMEQQTAEVVAELEDVPSIDSYVEEENTDEAEIKVILDDPNLFKKQLNSTEQKYYNAGYNSMVKGNGFGFSFSANYYKNMPQGAHISNAISALVSTYPHKFDWMNKRPKLYASDKQGGGWSGSITYNILTGDGTYKVSISKSKHYSAALVKEAQAKVKTLTDEAYVYAAQNYPNSPAYGIVRYFNDWIVKTNYYNNVGTSTTQPNIDTAEYYYCHSSIGILLKGYGVCESYALAMNRLLDEAGIPSMYVVGNGNGGGHAWNYVKMPNGSWYMMDTTWNDSSSSDNYFLTPADSKHAAHGQQYNSSSSALKTFSFTTLASTKYSVVAENVSFDKSELCLAKGKKTKVVLNNYYKNFRCEWASSDPKVAKIDAKGNVTAVAPGKAVLSCKVAGKSANCTVYVYQWTGLSFAANGKSSYSHESAVTVDPATTTNDSVVLNIAIGQKNATISAQSINSKAGIKTMTATSSNTKIATVTSLTLSNNNLILKVDPKAFGTAKITVNFDGKKATLNLKVAQAIQAGYLDFSDVKNVTYTGKAFKPKVVKSASAPKNFTYKVTYLNNTNAGIATVKVVGTGKFAGTVTKNFTIAAVNLTANGEFKSCTASAVFNGAPIAAKTTVKCGGKTLKAGVDYDVYYNNVKTVPTNAGSYTVAISGKGNYSGKLLKTLTYEIKKAPITKVSIVCPASVKYTGGNVAPAISAKIGKNVISNANYTVRFTDAKGTAVSSVSAKGKYYVVLAPRGNVEATAKVKEIKKAFTVK